MKKRLTFILLSIFMIFSMTSCSQRMTLLFLNWGEYIDESLLDAFEEKYNCNVLMDLGESNEIFYSKVFAGTTVYDVVCPSDYMVMKMYKKDLIREIDFSRLNNYDPVDNIRDGVLSIREDMIAGTDENITNYYVPYLWGTWGIMYSTLKEGLEDAVINSDSAWASLFDRNSLPSDIKVAMYDSHQHAYYAACRYLGLDPSIELPQSRLDEIRKLVEKMGYNAWGTDSIKKDIVAGNIDVGFMWTGDFLYYYAEQAAARVVKAYIEGKITEEDFEPMLEAITDSNVRKYKNIEIGFDIYIPEDTIAFCDNLVITKDSSPEKEDLIYKFIDFMCAEEVYINETEENGKEAARLSLLADEVAEETEAVDEENIVYPANANTQYVCYDSPFKTIYSEILDLAVSEDTTSLFTKEAADEAKASTNPYDSDIYWAFYNYALSKAFDKYYPENGKKGSILGCFERKYVNLINNTFNNARA